MMKSLAWILVLLFLTQDTFSARFLIVLPTVIKSHFVMLEPYMKGLLERGHHLVVISHFPQNQPKMNFTDIVVEGHLKGFSPGAGISIERVLHNKNPIMNVKNLANYGVYTCESVLSQPVIKKLINSKEKFDVVINDIFHTDCFLAFAHKFGALSIGVSTSVLMPWANDRMGNPDNPSYIPNLFSPYSNNMGFIERVINGATTVLYKLMYQYLVNSPTQKLVHQYFGEDTPDLSVLAKNTSLVLMNSHFSLNSPRPLVPGMVEIGGIHIPPPRPLPKHLQEYLDGAEYGVIYFSLGSMLQANTFPEEKTNAFLEAFAELPQKVLWKWEGDTLPGQPANVRTEKWCPQADILRHPNVVAFLSHGGLLGTLEAAYGGVPVVGIPFYGDQRNNLANLEVRGMGIKLEYDDITKESVLEALHAVLDQHSYIENARQIGRIFRDRPQSALDSAIYWTEYVIRHRGAPHLKSAAVNLAWYQYLYLDFAALVVVIVLIIRYYVRRIIQSCSSQSSKRLHKQQTLKKNK